MMLFLGTRRIAKENIPALVDASREILRLGGVRREKMIEGWSGIAVVTIGGKDVHVFPGPDETVEFWCAEPSIEFVDESS